MQEQPKLINIPGQLIAEGGRLARSLTWRRALWHSLINISVTTGAAVAGALIFGVDPVPVIGYGNTGLTLIELGLAARRQRELDATKGDIIGIGEQLNN